MNKPKMIIFDYGQTLVNADHFNALKGTKAVLDEAAYNPNNVSAEEVQALADELNNEIGRYTPDFEKQNVLEIHNHIFQNYLYEYFGIELTKSHEEVEWIFESAATSAVPTENIAELLEYLDSKGIRTAVISNISFSGKLLKERIDSYIPSHRFEFIIASSEYAFRKPHKRIFELALRKAGLSPEDAWYCGDNAVFDVDGAAGIGLFPVWYKGAIEKTNTCVPKRECLVVNNWNEIMNMF